MRATGSSPWAFVLVSGLLLAGDLDAGSLEPPGPPAPTMKSLQEVEARVPIASLPFTISAPGSYYLTQNLTGASGQVGITITASFVTLDLNGFSLIGVPGSIQAIATPGPTEHVAIRNGVIRNWGARGIEASPSSEVQIESLRIDGNGSDGVAVGPRSTVLDTTSTSNGGIGISVGSGSTVTGCKAGLNSGGGISLASNGVVSNSTALANTGPGFAVSFGSLVTDCTAQQNGTGFQLTNTGNRIYHSVARVNAVGISGNAFDTVEGCTAETNTDDGIRVGQRSLVRGNLIRSNTNDGIEVSGNESRIEDNLITVNGTGVRLIGTNNLVVKNNVSSNTTEFAVAAGNRIGTLTLDPTTANPWANFDL